MTFSSELFELVRLHDGYTYDECLKETNEIIKLFTKLIDEKIAEQKTHEFHLQSKLDTYQELKEELEK